MDAVAGPGGIGVLDLQGGVQEHLDHLRRVGVAARPVKRAADLVGETRILFGSDWPLLDQRRCLDELKTLNLSTQTLNAVLGGNAASLLGLE